MGHIFTKDQEVTENCANVAGIAAVFSSILPIYGPSSYSANLGPYTWFIGVGVAGLVYYALNGGKSPHKG